ncbi:MAG: zinc-binding dehydrogenase [Actinobacteria bacterium]|nr:zinc-binding dehydrogenase [Actinomycetota bacterium]MBV9663009.1 zinc-binding dehydrogenase [Actinomycetota bacterium]MBV9933514.1 zinc-binding dehydrogenase [Actinomycetota bacterium]
MRAATIVDGHLEVREHPDPVPGAGELLVGVKAAGLNSGDLMQVRGLYPAPPGWPPDIPGLELAGEVIATGPGATRFTAGDRVMAVVGGGAQAELAVMHEREAMPVPLGVDWDAAGGFPEAFTTAHDALFTQCGLQMGESVLVHGAAGGVGTAGLQLAAAAGAWVTATVRNPELRDAVEALGSVVGWTEVVADDDFVTRGPYDVVLELIGAPNIASNLEALNTGGRIAVIGIGGGAIAEVNLLALMGKRARIHGSTLRARPLEQKAEAARRVERSVLPLLEAGDIQVPVAARFPLDEAAQAYERFAAGGKLGKIVITFP